MNRFTFLIFALLFAVMPSKAANLAGAAPSAELIQLTPPQRALADELVAKRIAAIQNELASEPLTDLTENIAELAKRKSQWQSSTPAMRIAWFVERCRARHVPVPNSINEAVVDDIIWQFQNAYGTEELDRKRHRAECARALGLIGHPKGVPFIIAALEQDDREHTPWLGLRALGDERLIPAIDANLDFNNQQDASPAIASLALSGEKAVPVLQRFLIRPDRVLRQSAVDALIQVGTPTCIPILKQYLEEHDGEFKGKIEAGIDRIHCRAIDKIYVPTTLIEQDQARLWHLVDLAIATDHNSLKPQSPQQLRTREEAAVALIKMGDVAIETIRSRLENSWDMGDAAVGLDNTEAARAIAILQRIGSPSIPALIDGLCDEVPYSRQRAAATLRQMTGQRFAADYAVWSRWFLALNQRT